MGRTKLTSFFQHIIQVCQTDYKSPRALIYAILRSSGVKNSRNFKRVIRIPNIYK